MIIDVRGTKAEASANPAHPYDFKERDERSPLPLVAGGLLAGLILYFRSMFVSEARIAPPAEDGADDLQPEPAMAQDIAPEYFVQAETPPASIDAAAGNPEASTGPFGSGGNIIRALPPARFEMIPSPLVDLPVTIAREARLFFPINVDFAGVVANDNPMPPPPIPPRLPETEPGRIPNRAPRSTGPVHLGDILSCGVSLIALGELLRNTIDPDGDALAVTNLRVSSGTVSSASGGWTLDPDGLGEVRITYQVSDGEFSIAQTAVMNVVRAAPIVGTDGTDLLVGGECADDIDGGAGDDNIDGRGGNDTIFGGDGDDHIVGGAGNDTIFAGKGDDVVFGGSGNDWISGGMGDDRLFGDAGDDVILGEEGDDLIEGGDGRDLLLGGAGDDTIAGGTGDDRLLGEAGDDQLAGDDGDDFLSGDDGDDVLAGGAGDDQLVGGAGSDIVDGGEGDDIVVGDLDGAPDTYLGGEGSDTIDYSAATEDLDFDLASGTVTGAEIGEDTISSFEIVIGGDGDDHFRAGGTAAVFRGGRGDDTYEFDIEAVGGSGERIAYEITGFMHGDRIRLSKHDFFEEILDEIEDRFEDIYGDDIDDDDLPIRISHDRTDDVRRTLIEADFDRDDHYELAITVIGTSSVIVTETT